MSDAAIEAGTAFEPTRARGITMTAEPWRTEHISEDDMKLWEGLIDAGGEDNRGRAHELLIAAFHEIRQLRKDGSAPLGPGTPAPRTVTCAWCGNRYRSAIPSDIDRGLQGSHCASDVVYEDDQWIVRGGYGSDEHDMNRYVFVANPPSAGADPVCDECISQRLRDGDLQEKPPENHRRPDDFSPRPPGTSGLVLQIRALLRDVTAMRALVNVATRAADAGHPELRDAVRAYQKHQRWTGELDNGGETYGKGDPEVARQLRETAEDLKRIANFWERRASNSAAIPTGALGTEEQPQTVKVTPSAPCVPPGPTTGYIPTAIDRDTLRRIHDSAPPLHVGDLARRLVKRVLSTTCPVRSTECAIRGMCTNACGELDRCDPDPTTGT